MGSFHGERNGKVSSTYKYKVYKVLIVWCYSVTIDSRIFGLFTLCDKSDIFVTPLYEYLFGPAGIEVVRYKFHLEILHLLEYLRCLESRISVNVTEYAGDAFEVLIVTYFFKIIMDTVNTLNVDGIVSLLSVKANNKYFFSRFYMYVFI